MTANWPSSHGYDLARSKVQQAHILVNTTNQGRCTVVVLRITTVWGLAEGACGPVLRQCRRV